MELTKKLWERGFQAGPSSGLNDAAALQTAERIGSDKVIVTVFPERMERYFPTRFSSIFAAKAAHDSSRGPRNPLAPVLQQAHRAYRDSGGSMKALILSLLTSDAFLYRTRES
ncbi:MAG: hypothetical protein ACPG4K_11365 [Haloferula sp.]